MSALSDLVSEFVDKLSVAMEADVISRVRANVESVFGNGGRRSNGVTAPRPGRPRKKAPIQLCPVPGCGNRAAPVFGMVCSEHKDLPKKKIRAYREARRAEKDGQKASPPRRAKSHRTTSPRKAKRNAKTTKRPSRPTAKKASALKKNDATPASSAAPSASAPGHDRGPIQWSVRWIGRVVTPSGRQRTDARPQ